MSIPASSMLGSSLRSSMQGAMLREARRVGMLCREHFVLPNAIYRTEWWAADSAHIAASHRFIVTSYGPPDTPWPTMSHIETKIVEAPGWTLTSGAWQLPMWAVQSTGDHFIINRVPGSYNATYFTTMGSMVFPQPGGEISDSIFLRRGRWRITYQAEIGDVAFFTTQVQVGEFEYQVEHRDYAIFEIWMTPRWSSMAANSVPGSNWLPPAMWVPGSGPDPRAKLVVRELIGRNGSISGQRELDLFDGCYWAGWVSTLALGDYYVFPDYIPWRWPIGEEQFGSYLDVWFERI